MVLLLVVCVCVFEYSRGYCVVARNPEGLDALSGDVETRSACTSPNQARPVQLEKRRRRDSSNELERSLGGQREAAIKVARS